MNRALLEKPFEPAQIRQRKGRNGVLDYVEHGDGAARGAVRHTGVAGRAAAAPAVPVYGGVRRRGSPSRSSRWMRGPAVVAHYEAEALRLGVGAVLEELIGLVVKLALVGEMPGLDDAKRLGDGVNAVSEGRYVARQPCALTTALDVR